MRFYRINALMKRYQETGLRMRQLPWASRLSFGSGDSLVTSKYVPNFIRAFGRSFLGILGGERNGTGAL